MPDRKRVNTYGLRRRFKGVMAVPGKDNRGRPIAVGRSITHGGRSPARGGWTCDDTHDASIGKTGAPTKQVPGRYKVQMPGNRVRYVRP